MSEDVTIQSAPILTRPQWEIVRRSNHPFPLCTCDMCWASYHRLRLFATAKDAAAAWAGSKFAPGWRTRIVPAGEEVGR